MKIFIGSALVIILMLACKPETQVTSDSGVISQEAVDFSTLSKKIIALAQLGPKEKVLLVLAPGDFNGIVPELKQEIEAKGAEYLGTISVTDVQPDSWSTSFTKMCSNKNQDELSDILREVDLGIMLPGASPDHLPYKVLQNILKEGIRRTIHFHWAGAYDLFGNLLETDMVKSKFYQDVILNTNYKELSIHQLKFENAMRGNTVKVTTPEGTDIQFQIGDRPVTKQDGDASASRARNGKNLIDREIEIPSGAIRVAPIEESVQGTIAFPDAKWSSHDVSNLIVTIVNGKIADIEASKGEEAVMTEMNIAGNAGRSFREFALGFNPLMPIQQGKIPWIPYYGYGAGIVRLSLGDNSELGGKVGGGYVRWNFFTNATVKIEDEIWVDNGKLVK